MVEKFMMTHDFMTVPHKEGRNRNVKIPGMPVMAVKSPMMIARSVIHIGNEDSINNGYPTNVFIHELAHGLEHTSNDMISGTITPLHSMGKFGYTKDWGKNDYAWYKLYYRNQIKGGTGINPRAFYRPSGKYSLISDDMTTGAGIEGSTGKSAAVSSSTSKTDISKVITVSEISDRYYAGKAVKPAVTVTGVTKSDYTVSYADNNAPGTAKVMIKGKGKYTGTVEVTFKIKLKKTSAKMSGNTLEWTKVPGADGYEIYYSKDGGSYKLLAHGTALKYAMSKLGSGSYKFKVRSYCRANTGNIESDWSSAVSYTIK